MDFVASSLSPDSVSLEAEPWPHVRDALLRLNETSYGLWGEHGTCWHYGTSDGHVHVDGMWMPAAEDAARVLSEFSNDEPNIIADARKWGYAVLGAAHAVHDANRHRHKDAIDADAAHESAWRQVTMMLDAMWANELHVASAPELVDGEPAGSSDWHWSCGR